MKLRYVFIAACGALIIGASLVLQNHIHAIDLAQKIIVADSSGQDTTTQQVQLTSFTASHMRTGVSLVFNGSYARAVEAARAASQPQISSTIYQAATAACANQKVATVQTRCVANYVSSHSQPGTAAEVVLPDPAKFRHIYLSPAWTFDLAGILLTLGAVGIIASITYKLVRRPVKPDRNVSGLV